MIRGAGRPIQEGDAAGVSDEVDGSVDELQSKEGAESCSIGTKDCEAGSVNLAGTASSLPGFPLSSGFLLSLLLLKKDLNDNCPDLGIFVQTTTSFAFNKKSKDARVHGIQRCTRVGKAKTHASTESKDAHVYAKQRHTRPRKSKMHAST